LANGMENETSLAMQRAGLSDFLRVLGGSSPGARVFESNGVLGAVVPACPERGLVNSMVYDDVAGLAAVLDEVESTYRAEGINARIVWVPEFDEEAIALMDGAGYRYDGAPLAMHADLDDLAEVPVGDLDWDTEATPDEVGRINDAAYGIPASEGFSPALASPAHVAGLRFYRARVDGETACIVGTMDHGSDLGFYFVATLPEFRGRQLTTRLMRVALDEGRERGLTTTSLQASKMGEPIYERLGYRGTFGLQLWEWRRAAGE
jgi:GNAT superfamily N-acetyltransferase